MPFVDIIFYRDKDVVPAKDFMDSLVPKALAVGRKKLEELSQKGHELRRPHADILRNGIYELRWKDKKVQYRLLYFFHARGIVIVSHGFQKKSDKVPEIEIDKAIKRKEAFQQNPADHTWNF